MCHSVLPNHTNLSRCVPPFAITIIFDLNINKLYWSFFKTPSEFLLLFCSLFVLLSYVLSDRLYCVVILGCLRLVIE